MHPRSIDRHPAPFPLIRHLVILRVSRHYHVTNEEINVAKGALKSLEADIVRGSILDTGVRIDGRDTKTVRPIVSEVGILPRAHGSALFTRGETQALVVATLGTGQDEQIIDALEGEYRSKFIFNVLMFQQKTKQD